MKFKNKSEKGKIAYKIGFFAELLVMILLCFSGYKIIKWRYRNKCGEIDLIATRFFCKNIYFCEIKYRSSKKNDLYLTECITLKQIERIKNAACVFVSSNKVYANYNMLFCGYFLSDNFLFKRIYF